MSDAPKTVTVVGSGGARIVMDVPTSGTHAEEIYLAKLASGELVIVDEPKGKSTV